MILKPEHSNPVSHVQIIQYKIDLVVKFLDRLVPGKPGGALRGEITRWSRASIRRFMLMVKNSSCEWVGLITLTYPREYTADGTVVKKQLNSFLQYLRRLNLLVLLGPGVPEEGCSSLPYSCVGLCSQG